MISGIYFIRNMSNGKIYIGSSRNTKIRLYNHRWHLNRGTHGNRILLRAWKKHGESAFAFYHAVSVKVESLLKVEQFLLDNLKPEYNISSTAGPGRTSPHTEAGKAAMSAAHKKRLKTESVWNKGKTGIYSRDVIEKIKAARAVQVMRKGFKLTDEHKEKLSIAKLGKPSWTLGKKLSPEHKEKLSAAHKGMKMPPRSEEYRKKISEHKTLYWKKIREQRIQTKG